MMFSRTPFLPLFFFVSCGLAGSAQTLFTYGAKPVSSKAFIKAFEKNPGTGDRKKAMEEYLPLYINYVLKVQDAYDKKLDTLKAQQDELMSYKLQLAESFLAEKAGADYLVDEAIKRMQTEVLLGHIYIEYLNRDTVGAIKKANEAYAQLKAGKPWSEVAGKYSTDAFARQNKGVAGWISPFVIPYPYETQVYNLAKGSFTQPERATEGVHIFSKLDTRPGQGTLQVAQILLSTYPGMPAADISKLSKLADSLYGALQKGANFQVLVNNFSQDRVTKFQNGMLTPFTTGTYDPVFEQAAFSMKKTGDISKPFQTSMGLHILTLVDKKGLPDAKNENDRFEIKQKVASNGRLEKAEEHYVKAMLPNMKFKQGPMTRKELQTFTDSLLAGGNTAQTVKKNATIFSIGNQPYTVTDWMAFVRVQQMAGKIFPGSSIEKYFDDFMLSKAGDYLPAHLDEIEPAFAAEFKEFKDANLLFEAMERNVWNKAITDSAGLYTYFKANQAKYTWSDNVTALVVNSNDSATAFAAKAALDKDLSAWRELNELYDGALFADSGRYEISFFSWADPTNLVPGTCTAPAFNQQDGNYTFSCVYEKGKAGVPKTFEEARGYVVTDYQQVLEDRWIGALKKKYPVKVNEAEWKKVLAQ
jgi:peptidyl-prolyl cis-trans isomerase SurA